MATIVAQRSYFSRQHIEAAAMCARSTRQLEVAHAGRVVFLADHRSYVVGAIFFSVAALEAAINELFTDASEGNLLGWRPVDEAVIRRCGAMWRAGVPRTARYTVVDKYAIALELADSVAFDKAAEPWQAASELARLRNALVHYEPEWVPMASGADMHTFEKRLKGRFASNPLASPDSPYYPDKVLGHGCAAWAVKSSMAFADVFAERLGIFGNPLGKLGSPELSTD